MIGWLLAGLFAAAIVTAIVISGCITKSRLREELKERGVNRILITAIDQCNNVVKIEDLDSCDKYEVSGDDVDYNLYEGEEIII